MQSNALYPGNVFPPRKLFVRETHRRQLCDYAAHFALTCVRSVLHKAVILHFRPAIPQTLTLVYVSTNVAAPSREIVSTRATP